MDDAKEKLFDPHWNNSITGDADGSYFCSTWKTEEAVCHYRELYHEMADELYREGSEEALSSYKIFATGPGGTDVTIRLFLVGRVFEEMLETGELP